MPCPAPAENPLARVASRRAAEELIARGASKSTARSSPNSGRKPTRRSDEIRVDGRRLAEDHARAPVSAHLQTSPGHQHPRRSAAADDRDRSARRAGVNGYFYPVGRLDYESEGLMHPDQRRRVRRARHASALRARTGVRSGGARRARRERPPAAGAWHRPRRPPDAARPGDRSRAKRRARTTRPRSRSSCAKAGTGRSGRCSRQSDIPSRASSACGSAG